MTAAHINHAKIANVIQLSSFRKRSCERRLDGRSKSTLTKRSELMGEYIMSGYGATACGAKRPFVRKRHPVTDKK